MSVSDRPELSVVIVNWNSRAALSLCLDALEKEITSSGLRVEVYVVDNGSTDGSVEMLSVQDLHVQTILNRSNPGFAAANNQALQETRGEHILLLNPDAFLQPGSLQTLIDFMRENAGAGAAGACILNPDGSLQTSCYPAPTLLREFWRLFHLDALYPRGTYSMHTWDRRSPRPVDSVLGACMLLRREALAQVGELDEGYFMYSEEIDLCTRIRNAGWSVCWVPDAEVVHLGGQSTRLVQDAMFLQLYRSKLRYFRKHRGRLQGFTYKAILFFASAVRVVMSPLAFFQPQSARRENLELASRYLQLLRQLPEY